MILPASCPVLQSKLILNGNNKAAVQLSMAVAYPHKILVRRTPANICLSVLKHADKQHIVIVRVKVRLDILEVSDHNRDILRVAVSVGIHHTALFGQIDAGNAACPFCQRSCNRSASGANLEHLVRLFKRNPVDDIGTERGKVVKNRPALFSSIISGKRSAGLFMAMSSISSSISPSE